MSDEASGEVDTVTIEIPLTLAIEVLLGRGEMDLFRLIRKALGDGS